MKLVDDPGCPLCSTSWSHSEDYWKGHVVPRPPSRELALDDVMKIIIIIINIVIINIILTALLFPNSAGNITSKV